MREKEIRKVFIDIKVAVFVKSVSTLVSEQSKLKYFSKIFLNKIHSFMQTLHRLIQAIFFRKQNLIIMSLSLLLLLLLCRHLLCTRIV